MSLCSKSYNLAQYLAVIWAHLLTKLCRSYDEDVIDPLTNDYVWPQPVEITRRLEEIPN